MGHQAAILRRPDASERERESRREAARLRLEWRADGLHVIGSEGDDTPVTARRCFPWSAPGTHVSLRDHEENEIALVEDVGGLDPQSRAAVEKALAESSFVMEIVRIDSIDEEFEIRAWNVRTRQGPRRFQTRRDAWPRELPGGGHLIRDVAGDVYRVADLDALDERSRELLWALMD
jgi:hypothetical protein